MSSNFSEQDNCAVVISSDSIDENQNPSLDFDLIYPGKSSDSSVENQGDATKDVKPARSILYGMPGSSDFTKLHEELKQQAENGTFFMSSQWPNFLWRTHIYFSRILCLKLENRLYLSSTKMTVSRIVDSMQILICLMIRSSTASLYSKIRI